MKQVGRVGLTNIEARNKIAEMARERGLDYCELELVGCLGNWPLAPAHRHKRAWYKGDAVLLSDYRQWVAACQHCHDIIENDPVLTENLFMQLRGKELRIWTAGGQSAKTQENTTGEGSVKNTSSSSS